MRRDPGAPPTLALALAEVSYGRIREMLPDRAPTIRSEFPPRLHQFGWQTAIRHGSLRFFERELCAADFDTPDDFFMVEAMLRAGVRFTMIESGVRVLPGHLVGPGAQRHRVTMRRASRLWWWAMSPDRFRELLQAKGASAECPVCGAEDWRGLDGVIDLPVRVPGANRHETHVRIPGFEALAPSCGRCGHVRLIDLQLFEAPVREGEAEAVRTEDPPPDADSPETGKRGRRDEPLTNLWGDPISRRGRR